MALTHPRGKKFTWKVENRAETCSASRWILMKNIIIIHADSTQPTGRDLMSANFRINFKIHSCCWCCSCCSWLVLPYYLLLLSLELKCNYVVRQLSMALHTIWGKIQTFESREKVLAQIEFEFDKLPKRFITIICGRHCHGYLNNT